MIHFPANLILFIICYFVFLGVEYLVFGEVFALSTFLLMLTQALGWFIYLNLFQQHEVEEKIAQEQAAMAEERRQRLVAYFRRVWLWVSGKSRR